MIQDQILAEIDATIKKARHLKSGEEASQLYEQLGRTVARLRINSVAYRKSERRKGQRIREELQAQQSKEAQG